jgi:Protein of unknown function (DUF3810)
MTPNRVWRAGVVLLAVAAALAPTSPRAVERIYSTGIYPVMQRVWTSASNLVPFALIDVLIAFVAGLWIVMLAVDLSRGRSGWARAAAAAVARTLVAAAALYLAFLIVWGLNYRRVPLAEKLQFQSGDVSPDSARALAAVAVDRVNALYDRAHRGGDLTRLADAFARTERDLGATRLAEPGRPKTTLLDVYFRRAAVDGMTDPYFLETLVAGDLVDVERPFVVAHEWSHLAGYADEGDANFVGWLTCLHGSEADQYSGWLFLYGEILGSVRAADRADLARRLAEGPRADRRAIADRLRRNVNPRVSRAGWRVYDRYLKANRIEAGAASYAGVVRLALGVRFGPDWTPLTK